VQIIVISVRAMPQLTDSDLLQRRRTSLRFPMVRDQQSIRAIILLNVENNRLWEPGVKPNEYEIGGVTVCIVYVDDKTFPTSICSPHYAVDGNGSVLCCPHFLFWAPSLIERHR